MVMPTAEVDGFEVATSPYRRELLAHCYRMTGSVHEAEDAVQETYVRAWRAFSRFEQRSSLRTWLYRIATNVCLTALQQRQRRALPSGLGPPSLEPLAPPKAAPSSIRWLEPVPDHLVIDDWGDPADIVAARQSVRLALMAGLQILPPRQRAALLLTDVIGLPNPSAAEVLDVSVAALKSLLQRARARLAEVPLSDEDLAEPSDKGARRVLDRYMAAFRESDMGAIKRLLAEDAAIEMTGTTSWYSGKTTCVPFIALYGIGSPGEWEMVGIHVNGQLGAAAYRRADDGLYYPFAVVVLATTATHLRRISLFAGPEPFDRFDLAPVLPAR